MKRCSMCGEIYDDRVDFCFDDGTPLEAVAEEQAASAPEPQAGIDLSGLDAPDPENISGLDAPDPMGVDWSSDSEVSAKDEPPHEVAPPKEASPPAAVTLPEAPTPDTALHTVETEIPEGAGQLPAGFGDPPSQFDSEASEAEDQFWDGSDDDLAFPDDFGTGEGSFGQDYTEPTIPAPRQSSGGGAKKVVAGVMVAVVAVMAFALGTGGDDSEEGPADTIAAADVEKPVREIERTAPPVVEREPVEEAAEEAVEEPVEEPIEEPVPVEEENNQPEAGESQAEEREASRPLPREVAAAAPVVTAPPPVEEVVQPADENRANEVDPWATAEPEAVTSRVRVFSKPSGAALFVDGRAYGSTPAELDLDQGQHSIRVEKDGYFADSRTVSISGATHLERFELRAENQRVTVNCYGPDSSKVYLDGKVICAIPGSGTVTTGEHTFRVVTPERFYRKVINVQRKSDGSPTPLRFTE